MAEALVVICILAVVIAVLLPAMRKAEARSGRSNCANNLRQIVLAFKQWPVASDDKYPMQVSVTNGGTMELIAQGNVFTTFLVMSNELNTPKVLICPEEADPGRETATTFDNRSYPGQIPFTNNNKVSYFVGVDAEDTKPQMFLVGDSCFSIVRKPITPGLHKLWPGTELSWTKPIRDRHKAGGFIGLADGSVTACDDTDFKQMLRQSGDMTNRLAIP